MDTLPVRLQIMGQRENLFSLHILPILILSEETKLKMLFKMGCLNTSNTQKKLTGERNKQ